MALEGAHRHVVGAGHDVDLAHAEEIQALLAHLGERRAFQSDLDLGVGILFGGGAELVAFDGRHGGDAADLHDGDLITGRDRALVALGHLEGDFRVGGRVEVEIRHVGGFTADDDVGCLCQLRHAIVPHREVGVHDDLGLTDGGLSGRSGSGYRVDVVLRNARRAVAEQHEGHHDRRGKNSETCEGSDHFVHTIHGHSSSTGS